MRKYAITLIMLALSGCVSIAKVETGEKAIGERMTVDLDSAWNQLNVPGLGPAEIWTMEGLPLDELMLYSGIKDGQVIHAEGQADGATRKSFRFRASMQPDEIASLFEGMLTRDGSRFTLDKLQPAQFGGVRGFRFDYTLIRKVDGVRLSGFGYGAVSKGELFAILYMAPRLHFFRLHAAGAERIAKSARIRQ